MWGLLIAAGLAAIVVAGILHQCPSEQPELPSVFDPNYNSEFAKYKTAMTSWCKKCGFSGFSGGACVK